MPGETHSSNLCRCYSGARLAPPPPAGNDLFNVADKGWSNLIISLFNMSSHIVRAAEMTRWALYKSDWGGIHSQERLTVKRGQGNDTLSCWLHSVSLVFSVETNTICARSPVPREMSLATKPWISFVTQCVPMPSYVYKVSGSLSCPCRTACLLDNLNN